MGEQVQSGTAEVYAVVAPPAFRDYRNTVAEKTRKRRSGGRQPGAGRPTIGPDARVIPISLKVSEHELAAIKAEIAKGAPGQPTTVRDWIRTYGIRTLAGE